MDKIFLSGTKNFCPGQKKFCPGQKNFVQDKIFWSPVKSSFLLVRIQFRSCPKFFVLDKIFLSQTKIFLSWTKFFCPGQKIFCPSRRTRHKFLCYTRYDSHLSSRRQGFKSRWGYLLRIISFFCLILTYKSSVHMAYFFRLHQPTRRQS